MKLIRQPDRKGMVKKKNMVKIDLEAAVLFQIDTTEDRQTTGYGIRYQLTK